MKVSKQWLCDWLDLTDKKFPSDLKKRLTEQVVEVEDEISEAVLFEKMVLGLVEKVEIHPNADRLKICKVRCGFEVFQIVCGGTNVKEKMKVAVAKIGSKVKWHGVGDLITLEKTSIRGVESEGMICASEEIGLPKQETEKEILDLSFVPFEHGTELSVVFSKDDVIYEIDHKSMTNRPDLFGHYGIAREISALYKIPLKKIDPIISLPKKEMQKFDVEILDSQKCSRYMAVMIDNVEIGSSPNWMKKRLEGCGIRSINNIVDITNYVLLELGQPMHAFDADVIFQHSNEIRVRNAKNGEKMITLDDQEISLTENDLVISNEKEPLALAGIMGGKISGVNEKTTRIIFESANFHPASIRKSSNAHSIRSESSTRFEKSLDPNLCDVAIKRAIELTQLCCKKSKVASKIVDVYSNPLKPQILELSVDVVNERLGTVLFEEDVVNHLLGLDFSAKKKKHLLQVVVPTFRCSKELFTKEDLIEEIARMIGYENIPSVLPQFSSKPAVKNDLNNLSFSFLNTISKGFGVSEVYCYAFTNEHWLTILGLNQLKTLELANPLSKERPLLVPLLLVNLLEQCEKNIRSNDELYVCTSDRVFISQFSGEITGDSQKQLPIQPIHFSLVYSNKSDSNPFWKMKQDLQKMFFTHGYDLKFESTTSDVPFAHSGRFATLLINDQKIGFLSELHPRISNEHFQSRRLGICEFNLEVLSKMEKRTLQYKPLFSYPIAQRDLAFVIDQKCLWAEIKQFVKPLSNFIVSVELFDVYEGGEIGGGKKSMAIRLDIGSNEKTLTSEEIEEVIKIVEKKLKEKFSVTFRS